jgi:hypothetical protein
MALAGAVGHFPVAISMPPSPFPLIAGGRFECSNALG